MILINSLELSHHYAEKAIKKGDTVVDATCGKGRDTLFLAKLTGAGGRVFAFDIQEKAVDMTKKLMDANDVTNTKVLCAGHERMAEFVLHEISCAMFNLGYLPCGDHSIHTTGHTTLIAILQAMELLKVGGVVTLVIYQGGDTGFCEKDMVLEFCKNIDQKKFTIMRSDFISQKNYPPICICIEKIQ